jgi:hypothetical protein
MRPGIVGDNFTGHCILPTNVPGPIICDLSADIYLIIGGCFVASMKIDVVCASWCSAHSSLTVQEWLSRYHPGRWIDFDPEARVSWPPRSPNLNPI